MSKLKITYIKTAELIPYVGNARVHSETQVEQLVRSIQEFGFVNPILIDGKNVIVAGHGRLLAAMQLGMPDVPVIQLSHLSERQRKALTIADNKIALNSTWDMAKLSAELDELADIEFDLSLTAFDEQEIDALLKSDSDLLPDSWNIPTRPVLQAVPDAIKLSGAAPVEKTTDSPASETQEKAAPEEFATYGDDIKTDHCCPSCGYKWSGKTQ
jgi:ParB-like chromosome segregation protein Spo0J